MKNKSLNKWYIGLAVLILLLIVLVIIKQEPVEKESEIVKTIVEPVQKAEPWVSPTSEQVIKNPIHNNQRSLEDGKMLFEFKCSGCHGYEDSDPLKTDPVYKIQPPHATKLGRSSEGDIHWKIKTGRGDMPAWQNQMVDKKLWDIVNYLQSIKSED